MKKFDINQNYHVYTSYFHLNKNGILISAHHIYFLKWYDKKEIKMGEKNNFER